ncbi:hypothetical protein JTB14_003075 [Gonioctena quinquepunctata]|nr:hypothetical protein JTB14_003075 [Gonioctena quinquepunctata]
MTPRLAIEITDIVFFQQTVPEYLKNYSHRKSPGLDNISGSVLTNCAVILAEPLPHLMQTSFDTATLPASWLTSSVTPIFKKYDKLDPSNYRPNSLTPICAE